MGRLTRVEVPGDTNSVDPAERVSWLILWDVRRPDGRMEGWQGGARGGPGCEVPPLLADDLRLEYGGLCPEGRLRLLATARAPRLGGRGGGGVRMGRAGASV